MSAFMCSDDHLFILAVWADNQTYRPAEPKRVEACFYDLWLANAASLKARYGEEIPEYVPNSSCADYERIQRALAVSPVVVMKLARCYEYQACEDDGYYGSLGARWARHAQSHAAARLPGYEKAPWGVDSLKQAVLRA